MRIELDPKDWEFLDAVERLGSEGRTQEEIAAHFLTDEGEPMTRGQLNYRLSNLGYVIKSANRLESTAFQRPFSELREAGMVGPRAEMSEGVLA